MKNGDAKCLLDYFKKKRTEDPLFFHPIRTNAENEICGVFFCDGKSRTDYAIFGDVVVFDTTFKINKYGMVCAPIVGVNHHGQTTLFGCGLLDGETADACKWFFDVFLEAMGGKKPKTIFTDQAAAIANAIREVLPDSHHRLCLWHIYQNASKHLNHVFQNFSTFSQDLKRCIYDPESVEEFESSWKDLLHNYDLKENEWLKDMYALREKWAQIYGRSNFCAGMTTTQRSESINKTLKKFFSKNLILCEWVIHYERILSDRREKELLAEVATTQKMRKLLSNWKVESEAAKVYTKSTFNCFQGEYRKCLDLVLEKESDDGQIERYVVHRPGNLNLRRSVIYSSSNKSVCCSCRRFEFDGILCAHALKLFRELGLSSIPSQYFLKRWRRDVRKGVHSEFHGEEALSDQTTSLALQYSHLSHLAQRIVAKGAKDKKSSALVETKLLELEAQLDGNAPNGQDYDKGTDLYSNNEVHENNANLVLCDPQVKKRKRFDKGDSVPKKKRVSRKKKDSQEPNRHENENISTSVGLVNQVQSNTAFIHHEIPTNLGSQGIPLQYPYGFQSHGIPPHYSQGTLLHYPYIAQVMSQGSLQPTLDYPLMYSQSILQSRPQGSIQPQLPHSSS